MTKPPLPTIESGPKKTSMCVGAKRPTKVAIQAIASCSGDRGVKEWVRGQRGFFTTSGVRVLGWGWL